MTIVTPNPYADKDTDPEGVPFPTDEDAPQGDDSDPYADTYGDPDDLDNPDEDDDTAQELSAEQLTNKQRIAGLVRVARGVGLLDDTRTQNGKGSDLSLTDYLSQTPNGPLPQPITRELDTRDAVLDVLGVNRLRFFQLENAKSGGHWESWKGDAWSVTTEEAAETLVGSLIHPTTNEEVPQRIRPVKFVALSDPDKHLPRINEWVSDGLVEHDKEGKKLTLAGTDDRVRGYYTPDMDWTGRGMTARSITSSLKGRLTDNRPLDLTGDLTLNLGGVLVDISEKGLGVEDGQFRVNARPVRRHDLVSKRTRASYNPSKVGGSPNDWCPKWTEFVSQVMSHRDTSTGLWVTRPEHERALQKFAGLMLLPNVDAQRFALFYGPHGNNAKSLCADVLRLVMGEYGYLLGRAAITKTFGEQHPTDLMGLVGSRVAVIHEMYGDQYDSTKTKGLVSDPVLKARGMGENMGNYPASASLILTSNELPEVYSDTGFWKRLVLFPFDARWSAPDDSEELKAVSIGPENTEMLNILLAEADGIILWMLYGLYLYYTEKLTLPASMLRAKVRAQGTANEFAVFMDESVEYTGDPNDFIDTKVLFPVWGNYVDEVLMGKWSEPKSPSAMEKAVPHVHPQVIARHRTRKGASKDERNGFGGVRLTDLGLARANACHALKKEAPKMDGNVVHPQFGASK